MRNAWRLLQAASASLLITAALVASAGVPINDNCRVCFENMPAWTCYLIGCWW